MNTNCTMQCMHTYLLTSDGQIMQASLATHHQVKIDALKQMCEKVVKNRMHHLHSPVSLEINRVIYNPCPLYYVVTNHLTWDNTTTYQVHIQDDIRPNLLHSLYLRVPHTEIYFTFTSYVSTYQK